MKRHRKWVALIGLGAGLLISALAILVWYGRYAPAGRPGREVASESVTAGKLLYLREVDGRINLWLDQGSDEPMAVSDEPLGIWDYSVTPDGHGVLLVATAADGSDDIVLVGLDSGRRTVLVDCQATACREPRWQPEGRLVAYEAHPQSDAPNSVWLLDTTDGRHWPAISKELLGQAAAGDSASLYPRWSADGRYLALYLPDARAIAVLEPADIEPYRLIPANLDLMGAWSPVAPVLAYTELALADPAVPEQENDAGPASARSEGALYGHLVVTDLLSGRTNDLSVELAVNDGQPRWHPDGRGIAASRSDTGVGQLWFYSLDTGNWRPLTGDPAFRHTAPAWSWDGRYLAFMRQAVDEDSPAIWLINMASGESRPVLNGAFWPGWLP